MQKRVIALVTACILAFTGIFTTETVHASPETAIDSIETNEQAKQR